MIRSFLALAVALVIGACSVGEQDIVVVKLSPQPGPGRIPPHLGEDGPAGDPTGGLWDLSDEVVVGVPDTLSDLHVRFIDLQESYLLLDAYKSGRVDSTTYHAHRDRTRSFTLPNEPFDSHIHYAIGREGDGDFIVVFDTDNDEDLSDESGVRFSWEGPRMDRLAFFSSVTSSHDLLKQLGSLPQTTVAAQLTDGERVFDAQVPLAVAPHLKVTFPTGDEGVTVDEASFVMGSYANMVGIAEVAGTSHTFWAGSDRLAVFDPREAQIWFEEGDTAEAPPDSSKPFASDPYLIGQVIDLSGQYYRLDDIAVDGSALRLVRVESMPGIGVRPGMEAPTFRSVTIEGNALKLSDYRGKYVLLDFWSTSCGPCIKDLPATIALYDELSGDDFEIIGIAEDDPDWLRQFVRDNGITWPQVPQGPMGTGEQEIFEKYRVTGIPSYFLVDREGKVALGGWDAAPWAVADTLRSLIAG